MRDIWVSSPNPKIIVVLDETFGNEGDNDITHVLLEQLAARDANAALLFTRIIILG